MQAGFTHFKPSAGYNSGPVVGNVLFGFTYLLDLVLVADIVVSTKKAVQTPTGQSNTSLTLPTAYTCCCYGDVLVHVLVYYSDHNT